MGLHDVQRLIKIQAETKIWEDQNFGPQAPYRGLLGVIEELGELVSCFDELQPDRGSIQDAVGDTLVYLCGYCTKKGWVLADLTRWIPHQKALVCTTNNLTMIVGELCHHQLKSEQKIRGTNDHHDINGRQAVCNLYHWLRGFSRACGWNEVNVLEEVWSKVKQRDWKRHQLDGVGVGPSCGQEEIGR